MSLAGTNIIYQMIYFVFFVAFFYLNFFALPKKNWPEKNRIPNKKYHMGDFTQPQQKYAGTGENCNIAIAVTFYPGIKTL